MAHFAQVDENNIVIQVIVADQEFIDQLIIMETPPVVEEEEPVEGEESVEEEVVPRKVKRWIQTSYNTTGGVHLNGGVPLRANFASVGDVYDEENDVFYKPKPYPSFIISAPTWYWKAPVPKPQEPLQEGERYIWDEDSISWVVWRPEPEVEEEVEEEVEVEEEEEPKEEM